MDSLNIFVFPYTNLLVLALIKTAAIIKITPTHWGKKAWLSMPTKYIQKGYECHLLALYRLNSPTSCSRYPTTLRMGTTMVRGMENEDSIDVTVEMYIELQAPPEHIDRGIDKLEKMFNNIYFKTD